MKVYFLKFILIILILMGVVKEHPLNAQKTTYLEAGYSLGIFRSKVLDEWDNSIAYGHSVFQPCQVYLKFIDDKWIHSLNFYVIKNKLNPIAGSELFSYNDVTSESGELAYELLYEIYQPAIPGFSLYAGTGIRAFGSFRTRKSKSKRYPYEDNITAYDINAGSLQVLLNPIYQKNRHVLSLGVSLGIVSYVTRPDSYNPRFDSNNGKWLQVSLGKHFNLLNTFSWEYKISKRFALNINYRLLYYRYSFPYELKVLNQQYLTGISFKI
jgi:hypothetical protein